MISMTKLKVLFVDWGKRNMKKDETEKEDDNQTGQYLTCVHEEVESGSECGKGMAIYSRCLPTVYQSVPLPICSWILCGHPLSFGCSLV